MFEHTRGMARGLLAAVCRRAGGILSTAALLALVVPAAGSAAHGQSGPQLVSLSGDGGFGRGGSYAPSVSADGRRVAFASVAPNLVSGDSNGWYDIFVRDLVAGTTTCVSMGLGGVPGNGDAMTPAISADGRYVCFSSEASNLVPDDTNGFADVFVRDLRTGALERVSIGPRGEQADLPCHLPAISGDGRFVAWQSYSSTLGEGTNEGIQEIFVRDRVEGTTSIASHGAHGEDSNGSSSNAAISADGRVVGFHSWAKNLAAGDGNSTLDVYVRSLVDGSIVLASLPDGGGVGNGPSLNAAFSADGRYLAFQSEATNLVPGDTNNRTDAFVHDLLTGATVLASVATDGTLGNEHSSKPRLSGDGRWVVFQSHASNLVPTDTNLQQDAFLRDLATGQTWIISSTGLGQQGAALSSFPDLAQSSGLIVFESFADNFVSGDLNQSSDIFARPLEEVAAGPGH